jgi:predicted metal-dependent phosphoesterase TrpH
MLGIEEYAPDRQRYQVDAVAALIMSAVGKYIQRDDHKYATRDLIDALHNAGIDVITKDDREKAGLPPRNQKGWTDQELAIMDVKRTEAMLRPLPPIILEKR